MAPVINCASLEAKNAIPFATSKGSPALFNGILSINFLTSSSGILILLKAGVSVSPGLVKCNSLELCYNYL